MNKNPEATKQYLVDRIGRAGAELCQIMGSETTVLPVTGEDKLYVAVGTLAGIAQVAGKSFDEAAGNTNKAVLTDEQIAKGARYLADISAGMCNVDAEDNWKVYGQDFIDDFRGAIKASGAAPAPADNPSTAGAAKDLHDAIMRIPCNVERCTFEGHVPDMCYKQGHRDARHDAAELALSAPASPAQPSAAEWISVDDERKPEERKPILVFVRTLTRGEDDDGLPHEIEGEQVEMGEYRQNNGAPYFQCFASPMSDNDWVTHWMPLPAAPTAAQSAGDAGGAGQDSEAGDAS